MNNTIAQRPWFHQMVGDDRVNVYGGKAGNVKIATVSGWSMAEREAHARLIAAAPELLEALQNALAAGLPDDVARAARAVIAKAQGNSSHEVKP